MNKMCILVCSLGLVILSLASAVNSQKLAVAAPQTAITDSARSFLRGKEVYKSYCLSCHQFDGGGVENLNPPLIKTKFVLGRKSGFIEIIVKGFDKRVEVEGESYSNNMPPLNFLTDQQIADVMTYVRNDFGNKATAVGSDEVKQVRAKLPQ